MPKGKSYNNRAKREPFLANVIMAEVETEKQSPGLIRNLSLLGCYVETATPFSSGVNLRLIIFHNGEKVRALGKVAHAAANKVMGIAFTSVLPGDEAVLEEWMDKLGRPDDMKTK
jgi:hypothetical protein